MAGLFDLTGRTALITGSVRGIGFSLAEGLCEAGATVVVNGRKQAAVDEAVGPHCDRCGGVVDLVHRLAEVSVRVHAVGVGLQLGVQAALVVGAERAPYTLAPEAPGDHREERQDERPERPQCVKQHRG